MIIAGDTVQSGLQPVQSAAWFSTNGTNWGSENPIGDYDYWMWRTVWYNGVGYGISYGATTGPSASLTTRLSTTTNGLNYTTTVPQLNPTGQFADESGLTFLPNGTAVVLTRRDWETQSSIGISTPASNYTNWTFTNANRQVQSPDLLTLPDGRIVAAGRMYPNPANPYGADTVLSWVDPTTGTITPFLSFPYVAAGTDTGYPGLYWCNNQLWVSYYSGIVGPGTDIYVAQVSIPSSGPTSFWTVAGGKWSTPANWTNSPPNAAGATAVIDAPTTSPLTITLDGPQTIGSLVLGSGTPGAGYVLSGSGVNTLTLNNSGSGATITVSNGIHLINAPVVLADNLAISGSGTLDVSDTSSIVQTGGNRSLTMSGIGGTLILSGSDAYRGGTNVTGGTLILASDAALPFDSKLTVGAGGTLIFDPSVAAASQEALLTGAQVATPAPEPGTLALLIAALVGGLGVWRRRKQLP
jgi:autotransporter-associated beta strand protein